MARKEKQVTWEDDYVEKLAFLDKLYQERIEFLATFSLPGYEEKEEAEGDGSAASTVAGNGNEEKAWNYFAQKGFTAAAVAGILGNLKQESGVDPKKKQGGGGPGRGLVQWESGGRWNSLLKWAKKEGRSEWSIETQLDYLWKELTDSGSYEKQLLDKNFGGINGLKAMTDYKEAVQAFERSVERAGKPNMTNRYKYAKEYLDKFGGGKGSAAASMISSGAKGDAKKVLEVATSWLKKNNKYVFGGGRRKSDISAGRFDCSSFVRYCFEKAGHDIGDLGSVSTTALRKKGKAVKRSELKPGDLVFFHTYKHDGHVTIYMGNDKCIGTQSSTGVGVISMNNSYWKARLSTTLRRVL